MIALKILDMLLRLYMLVVLAVVIIRVLQVTPNKWTNLLDRMTDSGAAEQAPAGELERG